VAAAYRFPEGYAVSSRRGQPLWINTHVLNPSSSETLRTKVRVRFMMVDPARAGGIISSPSPSSTPGVQVAPRATTVRNG
jgi:hypothetical protein